tara:strand:+ start:406 stop:627 length:222 start_codon:yes stop_codon:yes gene_type:complete
MNNKKEDDFDGLTLEEKKLLSFFRQCSSEAKRVVMRAASLLAKAEKEKKENKKIHLPYKVFQKNKRKKDNYKL